MILLPLIIYFLLENTLVWKTLYYNRHTLRARHETEESEFLRNKKIAYGLIVVTYIRDFLLAEYVRQGRADLIYSPATQKLLSYLSIVTLIVAIFARFWAIKTIPLAEFFYPVYKKNAEWARNFWNPIFGGSWMLYLTAFLWQPSTSAVYPLIVYPILLQASFYFQENCERISLWFSSRRILDGKQV